jgi:hypothetical protein
MHGQRVQVEHLRSGMMTECMVRGYISRLLTPCVVAMPESMVAMAAEQKSMGGSSSSSHGGTYRKQALWNALSDAPIYSIG